MPHTFPHKTITARKPWRCDLCGEPIPVGASHLSESIVGPEGWTHHRVHTACEALRQADAAHDLAETLPEQVAFWFDHLRDLEPSGIAAVLKDHPPVEIARLTALWQRNP